MNQGFFQHVQPTHDPVESFKKLLNSQCTSDQPNHSCYEKTIRPLLSDYLKKNKKEHQFTSENSEFNAIVSIPKRPQDYDSMDWIVTKLPDAIRSQCTTSTGKYNNRTDVYIAEHSSKIIQDRIDNFTRLQSLKKALENIYESEETSLIKIVEMFRTQFWLFPKYTSALSFKSASYGFLPFDVLFVLSFLFLIYSWVSLPSHVSNMIIRNFNNVQIINGFIDDIGTIILSIIVLNVLFFSLMFIKTHIVQVSPVLLFTIIISFIFSFLYLFHYLNSYVSKYNSEAILHSNLDIPLLKAFNICSSIQLLFLAYLIFVKIYKTS